MPMSAFEQLRVDMSGYMPASILAAQAELDFSTVLLQNGNCCSAAELAGICSCDRRGTEALLDALCGMGYFVKSKKADEAKYAVADAYTTYMDSRHVDSCIPLMRHMACVQRSWAQLAWAVKDGTPVERAASILGPEQDGISFIMAMNTIGRTLLKGVVDSLVEAGILSFDKQSARILDIGGASGTYTEAFLRHLPTSTAAIFDLPVGIAQAKKRFADSELEPRVTLVAGDYTTDALPSGFDFAWISAIIHQMGRSESRALYAKTLAALNPGGMVAVRDYVMCEERTSPVDGALFGINMLVNTPSGRVYTFEEIKEDLELSGFTQIKHAVDVPSMCAVVTAKKSNDQV